MRDELEISMRMMGITDLGQVRAGMVNTLGIEGLVPRIVDDDGVAELKSRL